MDDVEGIAHQIAREARMAANCALVTGRIFALDIPASLFDSEMEKRLPVRSHFLGIAEHGELCRIDLNPSHLLPHADALIANIRRELEPFIIGVGKVRVILDEAPQCLKIVLSD